MPMTDPIADLPTRIRDAQAPRADSPGGMPASKLNLPMAQVVEGQGLHRGLSRWRRRRGASPSSRSASSASPAGR